jgi:hypothetical protein
MAVNIHLEVRGLQISNNCPMYTTQGYSNDPGTVFLPQLFFKMSQQINCGDITCRHTYKADGINNTFRLLLTHIFHCITQNKHT